MNEEQFLQFLTVFREAMQPQAQPQQPAPAPAQIQPLPVIINFEAYNKQEKFSQYIERFENYATLKNIRNDEKLLKQTFLNCVGSDIYTTIVTINAPQTIEDLSYEEIIKSLKSFIDPPANEIISQHRFLSCIQSKTETVSEYVTALRKFLPDCKFQCSNYQKSISDNFLLAQFIRGLYNPIIRERLLDQAKLDFQEALNKALAIESSLRDSGEMKSNISSKNGSLSNETTVNRISRPRRRNYSPQYRGADSKHRSKSLNYRSKSRSRFNKSQSRVNYKELRIADLCIKCGKNNHKTSDCFAQRHKLKCDSCHKVGHVSRVCITTLLKNKNDVKQLQSSPHQSDEKSVPDLPGIYKITTADLYSSKVVNKDTDKYFITVLIENKPQKFEIDSGCGYTLLPEDEFHKLELPVKLMPPNLRFRTYDAGIVTPLGMLYLTVQYKG